MDLDLLHSLDAAGTSFKLVVLLTIAGVYVLFELLLLVAEAKGKRGTRETGPGPSATGLTKLGIEAYRPVTSWTSRPE